MDKEIRHKEGYNNIEYVGLTKREQIAAMALQGLLSNSGGPVQESPMSGWYLCNCNEKDVAMMAIGFADALMAELEK